MKRAQKQADRPATGQYLVLKGISYAAGGIAGDTGTPAEVRVEPGEMLPDGVPADAIGWLQECGAIAPVFEVGGRE